MFYTHVYLKIEGGKRQGKMKTPPCFDFTGGVFHPIDL